MNSIYPYLVSLKAKVENKKDSSYGDALKTIPFFTQISIKCESKLNWSDLFCFDSISPMIVFYQPGNLKSVVALGEVDAYSGISKNDFSKAYQMIQKNIQLMDNKAQYFCSKPFETQIDGDSQKEINNTSMFNFILPQIEIRETDLNTDIVCNILCENEADLKNQFSSACEFLDGLINACLTQCRVGEDDLHYLAVQNNMTKDEWVKHVNQTLQLIASKKILKLALSRKTRFTFEGKLNPIVLLLKMIDRVKYGSLYWIKIKNSVFMGCSPEKLYERKKQVIECDAIAGTADCKVMSDNKRLLSEKNKHEHELVTEFIQTVLTPFCQDKLTISELSSIQSHFVQHLYQSIKGKLKPSVTDLDLILALHPTPAVGVYPKDQHEVILEIENEPRGSYAGILGWIGLENSEITVAIRSCLIEDAAMTVFTGVGIVKGSDPLDEWNELNDKLESILSLIEIEYEYNES